jgi:outer membrane lipoprotein SlyB
MSNTLVDFLLSTAKPFLHRCAFVVTAVDRLTETERAEVTSFVTAQLQKKFGLENALVLESCALSMLPPPIDAEDPLAVSRPFWQGRFTAMEQVLMEEMARQRRLIVAERLVRLLQDLMRELDEDLAARQTGLAAEAKVLQENSVAAIEVVLSDVLARCRARILRHGETLKRNIQTSGITRCAKAKAEAFQAINDSVSDGAAYQLKIEPGVLFAVQKQTAVYVADLDMPVAELRRECEALAREFAREFEANYRAFPSLGAKISVPAITVESISTPALNFSSSKTYVNQQDEKTTNGVKGGAAAGALAGAAIAGPVGVVVGAVVGAFFGSKAGDNTSERQGKLRELAGAEVDNYFARFQTALQAQIDSTVKSVVAQFEDAVRQHTRQYGSAVGKLIEDHRCRSIAIRQQAEAAKRDSEELGRRKRRLSTVEGHLKELR